MYQLIGLFLFITSMNVFIPEKALAAQPVSPPEQVVDQFFKLLKAGTIDEAYDLLFDGTYIPALNPKVNLFLRQRTSSLFMFGDILDFEEVKRESLGDSLLHFTYLMKASKGPIAWDFYFYRPKERWFLSGVTYTDQMNLLFMQQ